MLTTILLVWALAACLVACGAWGLVLGTLAGRLLMGPTPDPED